MPKLTNHKQFRTLLAQRETDFARGFSAWPVT